MTYYTGDAGQGINQPITDVPSSLSDTLSAAFKEGWRDGPINSLVRMNDAQEAINDPSSAMVPKAEADDQLKSLGVTNINVPDDGVTQRYIDLVTEQTRARHARQQILASSPTTFGSTPLTYLASLAGNMADPANLALMFVPGLGEVKSASFLGRATTRFGQGAAIGAGQAAVTQPFTAQADAMEGQDYSPAEALQNIVYGGLGGGLLHATGGAIGDYIGKFRSSKVAKDEGVASSDSNTERPITSEQREEYVNQYATQKATEDILPQARSDLEEQAASGDETAQQHVDSFNNGIVPDHIQQQISARANEIKEVIGDSPVDPLAAAAGKVDAANWAVREQAFRAGLSQNLNGEDVNVEPFFDLENPSSRETAIKQIADPQPTEDVQGKTVSGIADNDIAAVDKPDTDTLMANDDLSYQTELAKNLADQHGDDVVKSSIDDAVSSSSDDSYSKALKAYAICRLGR